MNSRGFHTLISWILYPLGDLIGQLITHEFTPYRLLALALAGGLVYRLEIPHWFHRLDQLQFADSTFQKLPWLKYFVQSGCSPHKLHKLNDFGRTVGTLVYFNPLWIARHLLFIKLATTPWAQLGPESVIFMAVVLGTKSFLLNLPLSLFGNYLIQAKLPLRLRYLGSIVLSGTLAMMYALFFTWLK